MRAWPKKTPADAKKRQRKARQLAFAQAWRMTKDSQRAGLLAQSLSEELMRAGADAFDEEERSMRFDEVIERRVQERLLQTYTQHWARSLAVGGNHVR